MAALACPKCGSDHAQRLRVIYEVGTSNVNTTSTSSVSGIGASYGGGVGAVTGSATTSTSGYHQTALAQRAAPPRKSSYWLPILGFPVSFFLLVVGAAEASNVSLLGFAGIGLSIYGIIATARHNGGRWRELMQKWEATYLCHRCGTWFIWS